MQYATKPIAKKHWDPVVRVSHWSLGLFFTCAYWTGGDSYGLHAHFGYCILLVVLLRLAWGFRGPEISQFADFLNSPKQVFAYLRNLAKTPLSNPVGHDPVGGWMIIALLISLCITTISGIVLFAMEGRGPLAHTIFPNVTSWSGTAVETIHNFMSDLCVILICIHVAGVVVMSVYTRQNLIRAMITGSLKERR
jgi:cytochrome b